jgi:hypothetical protein
MRWQNKTQFHPLSTYMALWTCLANKSSYCILNFERTRTWYPQSILYPSTYETRTIWSLEWCPNNTYTYKLFKQLLLIAKKKLLLFQSLQKSTTTETIYKTPPIKYSLARGADTVAFSWWWWTRSWRAQWPHPSMVADVRGDGGRAACDGGASAWASAGTSTAGSTCRRAWHDLIGLIYELWGPEGSALFIGT